MNSLVVCGYALLFAAVVFTLSPSQSAAQDPVKVAPNVYKVLMENEKVRVLEATIRPGVKVPLHSHPDHLAYILSGGTMSFTGAGGQKNDITAKVGETLWMPEESHSSVNTGNSEVRVLIVELKDSAAEGGVAPK